MENVLNFARALIYLKISTMKASNIIGFNSRSWFVAFYGSIYAKVLPVGVYSTNGPDACKYIADHSEAEVIIAENK